MSRVFLRLPLAAAFACCWLTCTAYAAGAGAGADLGPGPGAADVAATPSLRPSIGLVLAGGGAKGGAHIGVLKVLEEMRVPIDCIAGTSMGALVGGGYASGIPSDELERFVVGIDWKKVVGGAGQRDLQAIEQKRAGATYSNDIEMGLRDKQAILPAGILNTSNIEDLLRSYVAAARFQSDFDQLPIPYRAVATDIVSGTMVVLGERRPGARPCAPAWRFPACSTRSCATAGCWSTAVWSTRCRSTWCARWAPIS